MNTTIKKLIDVDGSIGGGQVLRTALAMSMATEIGFHITNIRKNRNKDGLMRQHLTCVNACAQICDASVDGSEFCSTELIFRPKAVKAENYSFNIGTGGSIALVLQAITYPLAKNVFKKVEVEIKGGTLCPQAPSTAFIKKTLLPCLKQMGYCLEIIENQAGFYSIGGGIVRLIISSPLKTKRFELIEKTQNKSLQGHIINIRLGDDIAQRELMVLKKEFPTIKTEIVRNCTALGCGNAVFIIASDDKNRKTVFSKIGMSNLKAEDLTRDLCIQAKDFLHKDVPCEKHLADQLLVPLTLSAGGRFLMGEPSEHFKSCSKVIELFTGIPISCNNIGNGSYMVDVKGITK